MIGRALRHVIRSPVVLVSLALLAAITAGIFVHWDILGFEKRAYIAKNEEVLDALPVLPSATLLDVRSRGYRGGEGPLSRIDGYTTSMSYRMPRGATWEDVLSFYATALSGGWEVRIDAPRRVGPPTPRFAAASPIPQRAPRDHLA